MSSGPNIFNSLHRGGLPPSPLTPHPPNPTTHPTPHTPPPKTPRAVLVHPRWREFHAPTPPRGSWGAGGREPQRIKYSARNSALQQPWFPGTPESTRRPPPGSNTRLLGNSSWLTLSCYAWDLSQNGYERSDRGYRSGLIRCLIRGFPRTRLARIFRPSHFTEPNVV